MTPWRNCAAKTPLVPCCVTTSGKFMSRKITGLVLAVLCCWLAGGIRAQEPQRLRVLVDTDVGSYLDDTVALALLVASPEVELRCVTTCGGDAETRAWIACRFLTMANRREVPAAWSRAANAGRKSDRCFSIVIIRPCSSTGPRSRSPPTRWSCSTAGWCNAPTPTRSWRWGRSPISPSFWKRIPTANRGWPASW